MRSSVYFAIADIMDASELANGCVVWTGPSLLDKNVEVGLILTGLEIPSHNTKTGAVIQSYILRKDMRPWDAVRTNQDSAVCGNCALKNRVCYVQHHKGVRQVWNAWNEGKYPPLNDSMLHAMKARNKVLRGGSYGEVVAIPFEEWQPLIENTITFLGYTHQWTVRKFQHWRRYCMASVETIGQAMISRDKGWRYYRIASEEDDMLLPGEIFCKHQEDIFRTCEFCLLCNGLELPEGKNIVTKVHGLTFKKKNFERIKRNIIMKTQENYQIYLYLPIQEGLRPEQMRVIQNPEGGSYLVQSYNENMRIWISQKSWYVLENAILDALLWYPLPSDTYFEGFSLYWESKIGTVHLRAYSDSVCPKELKHQFRATQDSFNTIKELISKFPKFRVIQDLNDAIEVKLDDGCDPQVYFRADFLLDSDRLKQKPLDDESISSGLKNFLNQMKSAFGEF